MAMKKMDEFGLKESGKEDGAHNYFVRAPTLQAAWKKLAAKLKKPVQEVWKSHHFCYKNLPRDQALHIPEKHRTFIK